jgi:8-oxo-dGTP pyrophosphatase MutT (NUDIX family)
MSRAQDSITVDDIRRLLGLAYGTSSTPHPFRSRFPQELLPDPPRKAAVLIPILLQTGDWHILFTRRTASLPEHSGQVAFPGGRSDFDDEQPEVTALREAEEEINLKPQDVNVLGRLNAIHTISNYLVTPVAGLIPWPYRLNLAPDEVSKVFTIPLEWLADPHNHAIQMRELPKPFPPVPVVYFEQYDGELLWGVSAEIMLIFLHAINLIEEIEVDSYR